MTSVLIFIAGVLVASVVFFILLQNKVKQQAAQTAQLAGDAAASRREADMLRSQLGDAREDAERRLTELRRQYERLMADAERKHAEERSGRELLMEKQFAERLQLLQEQLRTTT